MASMPKAGPTHPNSGKAYSGWRSDPGLLRLATRLLLACLVISFLGSLDSALVDQLFLFMKTRKAPADGIHTTHLPPIKRKDHDLNRIFDGTASLDHLTLTPILHQVAGKYNWCNMPHVRKADYRDPPDNVVLQYVEVIHRHHKRTPYNIFYKEDIDWSCDDVGPVSGLRSASGNGQMAPLVQWHAYTDPENPFVQLIKPGFIASSCQFPQLTAEGLEDAIEHGSDLRGVYAKRLNLSTTIDRSLVTFRVTNNVITSQVASGILRGFFPGTNLTDAPPPVLVQPRAVDTLEPAYPCPKARALLTSYTTGQKGAIWQYHLRKAKEKGLWHALDKVSGIDPGDTAWHASFDHYYDNLSAKQCHSKALPCNLNNSSECVSQALADVVYRLGYWEYAYLYRDAPDSAQYSTLRFGAWLLELRARLQSKRLGNNKTKYYHNIAHDGSISSLLGFLQVDEMIWPGMGSEVVFELYLDTSASVVSPLKDEGDWYLRVLWSGHPMKTSGPLGVLDMIPLDDFIEYINAMIGSGQDLYVACHSLNIS